MSTATRMTVEEYLAATADRKFTQLVDGELVVDEPNLPHALAQGNLFVALKTWTREAPGRGIVLFPINVTLDEYNVLGPDIVWLREERIPDPIPARLQGLPDLVVEVRSPSTWHYDVGKKKLTYERAGVPELWLVDNVAETVLIFRRSGAEARDFDVALELADRDALTPPLLPGFSIPVGRLFRR